MSSIPPSGGWQPTNLAELAHALFERLEDMRNNTTAEQQEQAILETLKKAQQLPHETD